MKNLTTLKNTTSALEDVEARFFDIPFENSEFQNNAFVVASQITPERAYRAIGLRLHAKLRALQSCYFSERKSEIRIAELRELIECSSVSKWDKMRHEIEIEEIMSSKTWQNKLKNDAQREIMYLYERLKGMPVYTRDQFEEGELQHFIERSKRQTHGITGGMESLVNITEDMPALMAYEKALSANLENDTLESLRISMTNQFKGNTI